MMTSLSANNDSTHHRHPVRCASDLAQISVGDIQYLALRDHLLVAMDFDGTLAHFSTDPLAVHAVTGAVEALEMLSMCANTTSMLLSGRDLHQLMQVSGLRPDDGVVLVGSHGGQPYGQSISLDDRQVRAYEKICLIADTIAQRYGHHGVWVERKPLSVGLHTRKMSNKILAEKIRKYYADTVSTVDTVMLTHGKDITEACVKCVSKGSFLADYRQAYTCSPQGEDKQLTIVFAGDDTTDETVFHRLNYRSHAEDSKGDIGIHVVSDPHRKTAASHALSCPEAVRDFLYTLLTYRKQYCRFPSNSFSSNTR